MTVAMHARHQRSEFAISGFPAPQHDLLSGAGFGLGPVFGAARTIGRAEFLRDDTFQPQLRGGLQNAIAVVLEMLDIADRSGFALWQRLQQLFQLLLALAERQRAKIHSISEQQIERKEDE